MTPQTERSLEGKIAVITGGSGVLGRRFAAVLAAAGAKTALIGRTRETLEEAAEDIRRQGGEAGAFPADVLDMDALEGAHRKIVAEYGNVDILMNAAGGNHPGGTTGLERVSPQDLENPEAGSFFDIGAEGMKYVFDLNFAGTMNACRVFGRPMASGGGGVILNISSMASLRPLTRVAGYGAAKAAVNNFTQWLAVHLAPSGIRVNALAPGFFLTNQNRDLLYDEAGNLTPRGKKIIDMTPLGRFGKPEELEGTVLWLVREDMSCFVTGAVIPVDGGFQAYSGV